MLTRNEQSVYDHNFVHNFVVEISFEWLSLFSPDSIIGLTCISHKPGHNTLTNCDKSLENGMVQTFGKMRLEQAIIFQLILILPSSNIDSPKAPIAIAVLVFNQNLKTQSLLAFLYEQRLKKNGWQLFLDQIYFPLLKLNTLY